MKFTFGRIALFAFCLTTSINAQAEDTSALASAQQQYAAKEYSALRATLAPLLAEATPHLEALFLFGMAAMDEADYVTAIAAFRAMLTRDPTLVRPRLELALALQKLGDRQAAKYHYEQVMAAGLPESVLRNIYRRLGDIREREPSLKLTLELTSDSNPRQSTESRVVQIGGFLFTVNNASQSKAAYGVAATADYHWPLPSDPTWFARMYGEVYEYPQRDLDSVYVQTSLGKRFEWGQHSLSLEAGGLVSLYQDRQQYTGGLIRAGVFYRVSPKLGAVGHVQARVFDYKSWSYLNGTETQLNLAGVYIPDPTRRLELGIGVSQYNAADPSSSYLQPSINTRYVHELPGGWITGARVQVLSTRYEAPDPYFEQIRQDTEYRVELDVLNRKLKWLSFSPRALVGYVQRDSNLEFYQYDRVYVRIGLTREF